MKTFKNLSVVVLFLLNALIILGQTTNPFEGLKLAGPGDIQQGRP